MKKIILLLLVFICSGCGKKLTCTYKEDFEDIKINNKIVFNFNNNTYKETDIMVFNDEESAEKYFNDIEEYIELYNLVLDKNKIISDMDGDIKLNGTKKELKKQYESYDYKCK
jgi:disulfide oxidoreductase YuzD